MGDGKGSFEQLLLIMPEGWEGKAKELGALVRGAENQRSRGKRS